ncbi:hypothetical protein LB506_002476 [Fusarium annulatum]|nr:hypothetical protein LB506_002476 [Fusarium annulatum]
MAPSKSPGPVDALIVNIPKELEPKGSGGSFKASILSEIAAKQFVALRTNSKAVVIQLAPGL